MNYKKLQKIPLLGSLYGKTILPRAQKKITLILPLLPQASSILDVGSGNCGLVKLLRAEGLSVVASDVRDLSYFPEIKPHIINSPTLPFEDNDFDVVTMITVLHHAPAVHHLPLLKEAARIGKRILIMEDVYSNPIQKHLTFWMDSLVNMEFLGHPHSNRNIGGWKKLFTELGLEIEVEKQIKTLGIFDQVIFRLRAPKTK